MEVRLVKLHNPWEFRDGKRYRADVMINNHRFSTEYYPETAAQSAAEALGVKVIRGQERESRVKEFVPS